MNNLDDFTLDWLDPLEEDEQFVGGIDEDNPVGGTKHYEQPDEDEEGDLEE